MRFAGAGSFSDQAFADGLAAFELAEIPNPQGIGKPGVDGPGAFEGGIDSRQRLEQRLDGWIAQIGHRPQRGPAHIGVGARGLCADGFGGRFVAQRGQGVEQRGAIPILARSERSGQRSAGFVRADRGQRPRGRIAQPLVTQIARQRLDALLAARQLQFADQKGFGFLVLGGFQGLEHGLDKRFAPPFGAGALDVLDKAADGVFGSQIARGVGAAQAGAGGVEALRPEEENPRENIPRLLLAPRRQPRHQLLRRLRLGGANHRRRS
ncbi:MAG: hypothetical protein BWZ10_02983 [candidate division BRC1 bacterium ADurb.BinA364]|nr:MAG: hypothetical protein BWZ10_02983 [candidate division BRC1 bacterium ADurb.BinA364]